MLDMASELQDFELLVANNIIQHLRISYFIGLFLSLIFVVRFTKKQMGWRWAHAIFIIGLIFVVLVPILSLPFMLVNVPLAIFFKAVAVRSNYLIKVLILIFASMWGALTSALSYLISLKVLCYFSKEKKYTLDWSFFFKIFAISNLPILLGSIHFLFIYFFVF